MPLSYSIAYGIIAGLMAAIIIWVLCFAWEAVVAKIYGKNLRFVMLDNCSHFYQAFGFEEILINEPGFNWVPPINRWEEASKFALENLSPRKHNDDENMVASKEVEVTPI